LTDDVSAENITIGLPGNMLFRYENK